MKNAFILLLFSPALAYATSSVFHIGAEGDFSRPGVVTPSEFQFGRAGIEFKNDRAQIDAELKMSFASSKVYAISSRNLFWRVPLGDSSQIFFGRRLVGWSEVDQIWGMGILDPLDSWDRLRSFSQGLTGIFLDAETKNFIIKLFASYVFTPEIAPNVVIENQRFAFQHPQAVSAGPPSITLLDRPTPLGYELVIPTLSRVIFRPSIMASFTNKLDPDFPLQSNSIAGYLPLNYFPIAMAASASIPLDQVVVKLHPRLLSHTVFAEELSYAFTSDWKLGVGILYDQVHDDSLQQSFTRTPIGTTTYTSVFLKFKKFTITQLHAQGGLGADVGDFADPRQSLFSSRLLFRNATQLQASIGEFAMKYIHEYSIDANWIALDWLHQWSENWNTVLGGDMLSADRFSASDRGAEYLADLRGVDRIRVGINYVF